MGYDDDLSWLATLRLDITSIHSVFPENITRILWQECSIPLCGREKFLGNTDIFSLRSVSCIAELLPYGSIKVLPNFPWFSRELLTLFFNLLLRAADLGEADELQREVDEMKWKPYSCVCVSVDGGPPSLVCSQRWVGEPIGVSGRDPVEVILPRAGGEAKGKC